MVPPRFPGDPGAARALGAAFRRRSHPGVPTRLLGERPHGDRPVAGVGRIGGCGWLCVRRRDVVAVRQGSLPVESTGACGRPTPSTGPVLVDLRLPVLRAKPPAGGVARPSRVVLGLGKPNGGCDPRRRRYRVWLQDRAVSEGRGVVASGGISEPSRSALCPRRARYAQRVAGMDATWDGVPVARERPYAVAIVVWRK